MRGAKESKGCMFKHPSIRSVSEEADDCCNRRYQRSHNAAPRDAQQVGYHWLVVDGLYKQYDQEEARGDDEETRSDQMLKQQLPVGILVRNIEHNPRDERHHQQQLWGHAHAVVTAHVDKAKGELQHHTDHEQAFVH